MSTNEPVRELPGRQWVSIAVVVGTIMVLAAVVLPAVHNARQAARKTQSRNNLKQIALAALNYHDVYSLFPIGGDVLADGTAKHGWYTRLIPYLEASDLYSRINMNIPWDHPVQEYLFKHPYVCGTIPGVDQCYSSDGYGLLHYLANPNVMHRNHCISIEDMTSGTANNWLCGEVAGNYQPWGYPFNWRPLNAPLNSGPDSYGAWADGGHICLADGSVRFFPNTTDAAVLTSLANAPPVATQEQTAVPDHEFQSTSTSTPLRRDWLEAYVEERLTKGTPGTTIFYDRFDRPYIADVYGSGPEPIWNTDHTARVDLQGVLERFPEVRILNVSTVNDENAEIIARFPNLEYLQAREFDLTEKGDAILKTRPKLTTIVHR